MNAIYKIYGVVEPEPGIFYLPWFKHSETIRMHGDLKITEEHPWFEFAKWARENSSTGSLGHFFDEDQLGKIIYSFNANRPTTWDELLIREGVE